ncbi:MAG: sugar ABC transporter permease [Clostridia bacterium]|nr:sugar ABC transporter permease [Clostridia bacterium]
MCFLQMDWLSDTKLVNFTLAVTSLWKYSGQHVVIFIAGIMSIPFQYYEAAKIDGASAWQQFSHITIPGISTVINLLLFLNIRGCLMIFDLPFVMTNGGPGYESSTFMVYTINTAFKFNQYGMASAMAVILVLIIALGTFLQNKYFMVKGW